MLLTLSRTPRRAPGAPRAPRTPRASLVLLALSLAVPALAQQKFVYPPAERVAQTDTYHGTQVADPYRWLEDPDSEQSRQWIEAENKITFGWLAEIPQREGIKQRLTGLWNYERFGLPYKEGGRYFYSRNDGLQNQNVLYTVDKLDGEPRVLLDPNTLRADGTAALAGTSVSEDGKYLAYGIAEAGSDWNVWKVREVATGKDLADEIRWVKFGGASWTKDCKGFFYSRFNEPKAGEEFKGESRFQKIYYHVVGTAQSEDKLIYERPDQPDWYIVGGVTEDGKYLVIGISSGKTVNNGLFYKDLTAAGAPVVELYNKFDAQWGFVGNDGPVFWVSTDLNAPKGKLVAIDTRDAAKPSPTVIPESAETLQGVSAVGGKLVATYLKDAHTQVKVFEPSGKLVREVKLPGLGSAGGFGGKFNDTETFYTYGDYTTPSMSFRYDVGTGESSVFKKPKVDFNPAGFETRQVFYTSKDGTKVPMFIVSKKGLKLDGTNPTLLYGYGGFNIPITPGFSPSNAVWLEMGGVYAVANLRGGGEYGEEWHQAGTKLKKQNVFDDFIGAAEWLIANKYTNPKRLAIQGGSNGGLLVGACMTQRPELFGACLPQVGVMDMLRFHKFTVGWGWVSDYGSSDDAAEFKALLAYSPYHNIKKGTCYPATMITTADHDDRVVPAHSFKFAAEMQYAQGCDNPILIRIDVRAGHGAGKPTTKRIEEAADVWSFLVRALNVQASPGAAGSGH